jgi:hypothetical protein
MENPEAMTLSRRSVTRNALLVVTGGVVLLAELGGCFRDRVRRLIADGSGALKAVEFSIRVGCFENPV